jgi:ribosomal protein L34
MGPEPALGTSAKVATEVSRGWTNKKHEEYWQSICGKRQAKGFLKRPTAKNATELLSLRRIRAVSKGRCHLTEYYKTGAAEQSPV